MRLLRRRAGLLVVAAQPLAVAATASALSATVSPGGNISGPVRPPVPYGRKRQLRRHNAGFTAGRAEAPVPSSTNVQQSFQHSHLGGHRRIYRRRLATRTLPVTDVTVSA